MSPTPAALNRSSVMRACRIARAVGPIPSPPICFSFRISSFSIFTVWYLWSDACVPLEAGTLEPWLEGLPSRHPRVGEPVLRDLLGRGNREVQDKGLVPPQDPALEAGVEGRVHRLLAPATVLPRPPAGRGPPTPPAP